MERERTVSGIDREDVRRRIDRLTPGAFIDHRGCAELFSEGPEAGDIDAEAAKQQRAMRLVERDELRPVEFEDRGFAGRFDHDVRLVKRGQMDGGHDAPGIAAITPARYSEAWP